MEPNYYVTNKLVSSVYAIHISGEHLVQGSGQTSVVAIPSDSSVKAYFYQFQADRLQKMSQYFQNLNNGISQPKDISGQEDLMTLSTQDYNPDFEIANIYQDELIRIMTVRNTINGYQADRLKIYERFKNNGDATPVEDEYSDDHLVKTIDPWMLEDLGNSFKGNEIIFRVLAKDIPLDELSYGDSSNGYRKFEAIGFTETDRVGKLYSLFMIDIQKPTTKMLSKISRYNFQVTYDLGADSFGTYFLPDVYNAEQVIDDKEVVDIQNGWTFPSMLAKSQYGSYTSRVLRITGGSKYSFKELFEYPLAKTGGQIVTSAGLEVISYDNQYLSYHIETKDNKYYLVANELLIIYKENKVGFQDMSVGGGEYIEINQIDKISTILGGQAIAFTDKKNKVLKTVGVCSYSERFNSDGECESCPSGTFPDSKFGEICFPCGIQMTDRHAYLCKNNDNEWAFKNGVVSKFDLERPNDDYQVSQAMIDQNIPYKLYPCNSTSKRLTNGYCEACPQFFTPDDSGYDCVRPSCSDNQITIADGSCEDCAIYTHPDSIKTGCISENCTDQYLDEKGFCQSCGQNEEVNDLYTCRCIDYFTKYFNKCVEPSCGSNQIKKVDGSCEDCQTYTHPDTDKKLCIAETDLCFSNLTKYLDQQGFCQSCPENSERQTGDLYNCLCKNYYVKDDSGTCIESDCLSSQIKSSDGSCQECQTYSHPNDDQTQCIDESDICVASLISKYLDEQGYCQVCPINSQRVEGELYSCGQCFDYHKRNDQNECVLPDCLGTQVITQNGSCSDCSKYTHTNGQQRQCIAETCTDQYLDELGFCQDCPANSAVEDTISCKCLDYFLMNGYGLCVDPGCSSTQIKSIEGECSKCDVYSRPDDAQKECITDTCEDQQIKDEQGFCKICPETQIYKDQYGCTCPNYYYYDSNTLTADSSFETDKQTVISDMGPIKLTLQYWTVTDPSTREVSLKGIYSLQDTQHTWDTTEQFRMCLEIGTIETGLNKRDQLIFYGNVNQEKFSKVLLGKKDGVGLSDFNSWCRYTSTDSSILLTNTGDSGVTFKSFLKGESNTIDQASQTAQVEFSRPLKIDTTQTIDLQATEQGSDFFVYLSYSYTLTPNYNSEKSTVWGISDGEKGPAFNTITLRKSILDGTCVKPDCQNNEITLLNGTCQQCDEYSRPDAIMKTSCVSDTCDDSKIQDIQGYCQECPDYKYKQDEKTCIADICQDNQRLLTNGKCQDCPQGSDQDPDDQTQCLQADGSVAVTFNEISEPDQAVLQQQQQKEAEILEEDLTIVEKVLAWLKSFDITNKKNLMMVIIIFTGFCICLGVFIKVCCCQEKVTQQELDQEDDDNNDDNESNQHAMNNHYNSQNPSVIRQNSSLNVAMQGSVSKTQEKKKLLDEIMQALKTDEFSKDYRKKFKNGWTCAMCSTPNQQNLMQCSVCQNPKTQNSPKLEFYDETCSICAMNFEDKSKVRITNCNHAFHEKCLQDWLEKRFNENKQNIEYPDCPNCSMPLIIDMQLNQPQDAREEQAIDDIGNVLNMLNSESQLGSGSARQSIIDENNQSTFAAAAHSGQKMKPDQMIDTNDVELQDIKIGFKEDDGHRPPVSARRHFKGLNQ